MKIDKCINHGNAIMYFDIIKHRHDWNGLYIFTNKVTRAKRLISSVTGIKIKYSETVIDGGIKTIIFEVEW